MRLRIDGLDEMLEGLQRGAADLPEVYRQVLRGPGGDIIRRTVQATIPKKSGFTAANVKVMDDPMGGVTVGVDEARQHPSGMMLGSIGLWLESGTSPHPMPRVGNRGARMNLGGRYVTHVDHPGIRARRVMRTALRVTRNELEAEVVDAIDTMARRRMNTDGGL
jgi:hypothetical protein